LQDAAVAEVLELVERIDAADDRLLARRALGIADPQDQLLARPEPVGDAGDVEHLVAVKLERLPRRALFELQRQDTHAHQVRAVDALEALDDDGFDPEQ